MKNLMNPFIHSTLILTAQDKAVVQYRFLFLLLSFYKYIKAVISFKKRVAFSEVVVLYYKSAIAQKNSTVLFFQKWATFFYSAIAEMFANTLFLKYGSLFYTSTVAYYRLTAISLRSARKLFALSLFFLTAELG